MSFISPKHQYLLSTYMLIFLFGTLLVSTKQSSIQAQEEDIEIAEEILDTDELKIDQELPWSANQWPFGKVIELVDLADNTYGLVVIDRYGLDESTSMLNKPFSRIKPGKFVLVSKWNSNVDGCYVETIVQAAPKKTIEPSKTFPTELEFGVNGEIITLEPRENDSVITYQYNFLDKNNIQQIGQWHMNHRIFDIDQELAKQLATTPIKVIKARLHFGETKVIPFEIGEDTVERWQDVYSFNPNCMTKSES